MRRLSWWGRRDDTGPDDTGAVAILVAVLLTGGVLLGTAALVIDVGNLYAKRDQLQNAADAAAWAVAQSCISTPVSCTNADQLRSGFTLQHGIENAVRDDDGPVSAELRRAVSETRLGAELEDALAGVGLRTGNQDMKWLVMAIRLQREVGGNLS
jgi:Flp pilus assembly protein TadB